MPISNITLVKIASIGGIATITMGILYRNRLNYNVRQTDYYKEALDTFKTHKGVVYLLGQPIREASIDVFDRTMNFTDKNRAQYKVPVRGSKQNGNLYFWAEKNEDKWNVNRMELELANDTSRRLLVKDDSIKK